MKLSLRQLEYVAEAARLRSVSGAADSLNISRSSIFMAIDKLEEEFGIEIFVRRRSKGLQETAVGKRAIARIVRILDEATAFENDLGGGAQATAGEIRIGCFGSASPHIVPQIIRDITADHPGLSVQLHEGNLLRIQDYLRSGAVEMLLTYDAGLSDEFDFEPLIAAPPHAVLAADDHLATKDRVSIEELAERPLLLLNLPQSSNYILSLFDQFRCRPQVVHRVESFEMVRSSVAAGLGIAVLNIRPMTDETYGGLKVVCKPLVEPTRDPWLVLATRRGGVNSRRTEIFAKYCRSFFRSAAAQRLMVR
jgi:DNA-binding transcriptional LysR family regulator